MASKIIRKIPDNFPSKKCESTHIENKQENHWGQRKLFMSELEFLT